MGAGLCTFLLVVIIDSLGGPVPPPLSAPKCWNTRYHTLGTPFTIVSITVGIDARYAACMNNNRRAYAHRHGYSYCEFDAPLVANRGFGFHKLVALRHLLRNAQTGVRMWYLDADALIVNQSIAISELLQGHDEDIVWTSEPEADKEINLHVMVETTLGMPATLVEETEPKWAIQGGSFVVRNTPWVLETMDTIYNEAGSMLVPRPPPALVPWASLSDRAQWVRWAYLHRDEARKHMAILPGRTFNSLASEYAVGDFVLHAGGGGAFANRYFRNPLKAANKYSSLLAKCNVRFATRESTL